MNTKYKLTKEIKVVAGVTLFRIQATRSFGYVKKGDKGGYIEKESNLSAYGDCWVTDNASVSGDSWVTDNASVSGNSRVYGNSWVSGNSRVYGNSWVSGTARVSGNASVSGNSRVYGDSWVYGDAMVTGNARVYDNAWVTDNARVYGNARATSATVNITGLEFDITICDNHMAIGCQMKTLKFWNNVSDATIDKMDTRALELWTKNKTWILALMNSCRNA